ncbi:PLP-dependent aminotransferase family protein, partial [Burkholderia contaminans]
FRPGVPALTHFPADAWRHAIDRALRRAGRDLLGYGDPLGEPALRESIARHLAVTRGVRCDPEQIVITEGAQGAIALCAQLLTNPGDTVWVEEPGYRGARTAMQAADLDVVPMPVDAEGLRTEEDDWRARTPRLVYTTPSNQFPTGAVLSISRRLALIDAARRHRAWIVEDDYDSEFRHTGEPIGAMHGLAPDSPVVYLGSFSKTMFPALRIGFLVLPDALLAAVRPVLPEMLRGGTRHVQLALADFIETGEYGRHLGRMRRLYRDRRRLLLAALDGNLSVPHQIEGGPCGLHLALRLPARYRDRAIVDAARAHGIGPFPLSGFSIDAGSAGNGLVLGFGNTSADAFEPMLRMLSAIAERVGGE